jgi:hypothetical protein
MKNTLTKSVLSYLQPTHRDLQTVLSKVRAIETLNNTLIPLLDPAIQQYCQVANLTKGILVILTANGSVASELRYQVPDLLKKLHKNPALKHIREIQSIVRPPMPIGVQRGSVAKKAHKTALLSQESAATLLAMAETIEDPELREVMTRIARHTKPPV